MDRGVRDNHDTIIGDKKVSGDMVLFVNGMTQTWARASAKRSHATRNEQMRTDAHTHEHLI